MIPPNAGRSFDACFEPGATAEDHSERLLLTICPLLDSIDRISIFLKDPGDHKLNSAVSKSRTKWDNRK